MHTAPFILVLFWNLQKLLRDRAIDVNPAPWNACPVSVYCGAGSKSQLQCIVLSDCQLEQCTVRQCLIISIPRSAQAFHELRSYHTRPLQLNWGPENVDFGKTHFMDPNINVRIFNFWKIYRIIRPNSFFAFSTRVSKNGPKNSQKLKKRRKMTKTISPLLGQSI